MNKAELTSAVADKSGLTKDDAGKAIDAVFEALTNAMKNGDEAAIPGFGKFSVGRREARKGRNPRTGEEVDIAASNSPKFKAAKGLKDALN